MKSIIHRILIAFACVIACVPLRAVPLSTFNTFCSSDYRYGGVGGLLRLGTGTITITGAPTTPNAIGQAYLYWLGFPSPLNPGALAIGTLNGQPVTGVDIGTSGDNGWATLPDLGGCIALGLDCESHAYRADVTALLNANPSPNGAFPITLSPNVAGASLLIVFQDGDATNDRDLIIMDGNDSNSLNSYDADGWTLQLSGFTYLNGSANLQLHVEDGQPYADADVLLNGSPLAVGPNIFLGNSVPASSNFSLFPGLGIPSAAYTRLWDIKNFNLVPFLTPVTPSNLIMSTPVVLDFLSMIVAVVDLPAGTAHVCTGTPPPVNNTQPTVNCSAPLTVEANILTGVASTTLSATVGDADGNALVVQWVVNGTPELTVTIPAGTPPTSQIVTFSRTFTPGQNNRIDVTVADGIAQPFTCTTTVTVVEPVPPVVDCGAPITVIAPPGEAAADLPDLKALISASDNQTPYNLLVFTQNPPPGTSLSVGTYTVSMVVRDEALNSSVCTKTVTVVEDPLHPNQAPVVTCGPAIMVVANAQNTAVVPDILGSVTVSDDFTAPNELVLVQSPTAGTVLAAGNYTITVTVTDAGGKSSSCSTPFVIQADPNVNFPPVIDCGTAATSTGTVPDFRSSVTVSDDRTPVAQLIITQNPAPGAVLPAGTYQITLTVTDEGGLTASCSKSLLIGAAPGTGTPGYWKTHPEAWPVPTITIGGRIYTKEQAIAYISMGDGDKSLTLFRSLVCAKLNVLMGNRSDCVTQVIAQADLWMAAHPVNSKVKASSAAWKVGEPLYITLDDYNNGRLCAPHRN